MRPTLTARVRDRAPAEIHIPAETNVTDRRMVSPRSAATRPLGTPRTAAIEPVTAKARLSDRTSAAVTPALLAAFLWKRATPLAGAASVGMGILSTLLFALWIRGGATFDWGFIEINQDTAYDYIIYPAFIASVVTLVVVSLLGKAPDESKWKPFTAD